MYIVYIHILAIKSNLCYHKYVIKCLIKTSGKLMYEDNNRIPYGGYSECDVLVGNEFYKALFFFTRAQHVTVLP